MKIKVINMNFLSQFSIGKSLFCEIKWKVITLKLIFSLKNNYINFLKKKQLQIIVIEFYSVLKRIWKRKKKKYIYG